jgi:NADPH-dependent ferric siderophore reductase
VIDSTPRTTRGPVAPGYHLFDAQVARTERIGRSLVRLTLSGRQLRAFGAGGDDQRIKLVLGRGDQPVPDFPPGQDWSAAWRAMPNDVRPHLRTYTVRATRRDCAELDIDVVLHGLDDGSAGPAASWAATARSGDPAVIVGPDRPGHGRAWGCEWAPPADARSLLLAGDETSVPAIGAILERLPSGTQAIACVEVAHPEDLQRWQVSPGVDVRWSFREPRSHERGSLLVPAVLEAMTELCGGRPQQIIDDVVDPDVDNAILWDVPGGGHPLGDAYAWLAGEAGVIKKLRRILVTGAGLHRSSVAFMGYWREGNAEAD